MSSWTWVGLVWNEEKYHGGGALGWFFVMLSRFLSIEVNTTQSITALYPSLSINQKNTKGLILNWNWIIENPSWRENTAQLLFPFGIKLFAWTLCLRPSTSAKSPIMNMPLWGSFVSAQKWFSSVFSVSLLMRKSARVGMGCRGVHLGKGGYRKFEDIGSFFSSHDLIPSEHIRVRLIAWVRELISPPHS